MSRLTIAEIFAQIASTVNQEASSPTAGGTEWTLWLSFVNRGVQEWAEAADWNELRKIYRPTISGLSQATISLPSDFKRIAGFPKLYGTGVTDGENWPEIIPEQESLQESTNHYFYVGGNLSSGLNLVWNPGTLSSGASLLIPYYSIPTSLASPAEIPLIPDSQFLVDRTIAYIFEARSDSRFQVEEQKARERLLLMVENNSMDKYNSYAGQNYVKNNLNLQRFRVGRD
jgi:hypothetical protein